MSGGRRERFGRLDDLFIDDGRWQGQREDFFRRANLPANPMEVPEYLERRLGGAYDRFLQAGPRNSYAVADEDGWHLSADPTEKLDEDAQARLAQLPPKSTPLDESW